MSDLVRNPNDRFSCDTAHFNSYFNGTVSDGVCGRVYSMGCKEIPVTGPSTTVEHENKQVQR